MAINITVAAAQTLDETTDEAILDIILTNTAAFTPAAGNIYYCALLTDSTPTTPLTQEVTFTVATAGSEIAGGTPQEFEILNSGSLIFPVTGSLGKILYTAP